MDYAIAPLIIAGERLGARPNVNYKYLLLLMNLADAGGNREKGGAARCRII